MDWENEAARLEEPTSSETWKPETGDSIAGRVLSIEPNAGTAGGTLARLEKQDGETVGVWLSAVLEREFEKLQVIPGSVVGIKFFGYGETKNGREYKRYAVRVLEREFEDDIPL